MAEPILDSFALFGPIPPQSVEPGTAALQAALRARGVAGAVTLSTRAIYHSAAAGNRETATLCAESGGALLPAAILDPRLADPLGARTDDARLLCLFPATQGWPVAYAPLVETLTALTRSARTTPLLFEASRPGDATALVPALRQSAFAGPVVLIGVDGVGLAEALAVARQWPAVHVGTDGLRGIGEIALAVANLGAERVLFGSGAVARRSLAAALALLQAAELTPETRARVQGGNLRRLLTAGGSGS